MELHAERVVFVVYPGEKYCIQDAAFNPGGARLIVVLNAE